MDDRVGYDNRPFSERMGIKQKKKIQIDSMDDELRKRIWNAVYKFCFKKAHFIVQIQQGSRSTHKSLHQSEIVGKVFDCFLKEDASLNRSVRDVRVRFYKLEWNRVYDFVEFMLTSFSLIDTHSMRDQLNLVLEEESAGYRIMGGKVTPITNELEMDEVEKAQHTGISEIDKHMESAISLLSDRDNSDPRNATKEAISAVEALCKKITGDNNATLGQALSKIQSNDPKLIDLHLEEAIRKLYSFSSDASGVRHAHAEGKTQVGFDEAKFMVVTCSAIVNYLVKHAASG